MEMHITFCMLLYLSICLGSTVDLFLCKSEFLYKMFSQKKMFSQDYTEVTYSRSYVKTGFTSFVNLINFYW